MNARADGKPKQTPRIHDYGITWRDRRKPWFVKFRRDKKQVVIGSFATIFEAREAAKKYLEESNR